MKEVEYERRTEEFNVNGTCSDEEVNDFLALDGAKKKTGRKTGYRMPGWSKSLLASRRSSIALEAVNAVLTEMGEVLSEMTREESYFMVTMAAGNVKHLAAIGKNMKQSPNARNFLFKDIASGLKINYVVQEIYDGLISGMFVPVCPAARDKLYSVLMDSDEVRNNIKERAAESRKTGSRMITAAANDFDEDDFFSLKSSDGVDAGLLKLMRTARSGRLSADSNGAESA